MDQVVPWAALVELIASYYPKDKKGRPPFSLQTMLRAHFLQQGFTLSDPGMEEAFFDTPLYREFAKNKDKARDPEMHSSQKGNQWHFGMKTHIGVDSESGLVHTVRGTSGNVHDVLERNSLLHDQEENAYSGLPKNTALPRRSRYDLMQIHQVVR